MIDRAAAGASSKINFMITHYFVDEDKDLVPEYFCYKPGASRDCVPFDQVGGEGGGDGKGGGGRAGSRLPWGLQRRRRGAGEESQLLRR
jgi:hypothetical protein